MNYSAHTIIALSMLTILFGCNRTDKDISASIHMDNTPILSLTEGTAIGTVTIHGNDCVVEGFKAKFSETKGLKDIVCTKLIASEDDSSCFNLLVKIKDTPDLSNRIKLEKLTILTNQGKIKLDCSSSPLYRTGIALRQRYQDGVNNCRIPGLVTTTKGTLLAMYDARRDADRDLQGDIDICYNRSTDGGRSWSEMKVALDMGAYGGLPQKYNGVSDGSMLVDTETGDIFVTGLWMYGVHDPETGEFVEGLTEESTEWNHQWRSYGSQAGYDIKQSCQYLIAKSTDDGISFGNPINITRQVKPEAFWLIAPAPGAGIVLEDGTLVLPSEGRTETGLQFSTIIYSKDHGETWTSGSPAYTNTNECMAVQLSDGSIMLNARERSNRNKIEGNGRKIATTNDLGQTWTLHPTNQSALIEPACQGSLLKHCYRDKSGSERNLLLFFNPSSISKRENFTLKMSLDDGMTWPEEYWIQFDALPGEGYSCMTSIDNDTIGILYEGSGANLVFQQIKVEELLQKIQ